MKTFEYEGAVNTLKALIKVSPDSALGYYYLGKTYDQMKLSNEAIKYYKKAVELKPDFDQAFIDLAITQEMQGLTKDAINAYKELLKINPVNYTVVQHLVQLYIQNKDMESALILLQDMARNNIGGQESHRKLGLILLEMERYEDAITEFCDILRQDPEAYQVRYYLASTYEEMEDFETAIEEFKKNPDFIDLLL
ncbi:tetratricopeptide repeat protein [Geotalea toluenoxydans]|uniref:tetratricopeptide repeat protein n=1 Tax=Geotalea toluenoxydans TaxID=421624 RepID=UPI000ADA9B9D|nr:tetratricopeptide repeat protein [Geotalea toluenoxydans]